MDGIRTCVVALLLAWAGTVGAAKDDAAAKEHVAVGTEAAPFEVQRTRVLSEMQDGGRYAEIDPRAKDEVLEALSLIEEILGDGTPVAELEASERAELFNAQELINTRLTLAAEDSRVTCERIKRTGTRIATTVCETQAEWRLQRELGEQAMRQTQRGVRCANGGAPCVGMGGGAGIDGNR